MTTFNQGAFPLAVSKNGTVYGFSQSTAGEIVIITSNGSVSLWQTPQEIEFQSEYPDLFGNVNVNGISVAPDGSAWYTGNASFLAPPYYQEITWGFVDGIAPDGTPVGEVNLPIPFVFGTIGPVLYANGVTFGPQGRAWLSLAKSPGEPPDGASPYVSCLELPSTLCDYTSYIINPGTYSPLVAGPDNAMWFVNLSSNSYMMRVAPNGSRSVIHFPAEYRVQSASTTPQMTVGPDGALWFTTGGTRVGRMTLGGYFSFYTVPGASAIVTGSDGNLWMTTTQCTLLRMTPKGVVTLTQSLPQQFGGCSNNAIAAGTGTLWIGSLNTIIEVFLPTSG